MTRPGAAYSFPSSVGGRRRLRLRPSLLLLAAFSAPPPPAARSLAPLPSRTVSRNCSWPRPRRPGRRQTRGASEGSANGGDGADSGRMRSGASPRRRGRRSPLLLSRRALSASVAPLVAGVLSTATAPAAPAEQGPAASAPISAEPGDSACGGGALAQESSIPGAYQSECMALSERTIPVTVAAADVDCAGGGRAPREHKQQIVWLTVRQRPGGVGPGSTGLAVWNSGLLLSRLLQRLGAVPSSSSTGGCPRVDNWLRGKSVLELGCGAGLGSLTCAALGASRVWATDGNPDAVELALENARANRLDSAVLPRVLPWGLLAAADYEDSADVVVGSDLTYNSGSWRLLAETMAAVLKPDGRVLYVTAGHAGFPARAEVEGFLAVAREQGLVQVSSASDPLWPFGPTALSGTAGRDLSDLLVEDCLWSASEREIAESSGGVRAVLLARKRRKPP